MQDYRKLRSWEFAHELALDIYQVTTIFPETEKYGLVFQLRRAAASVPTNLAEGCAKNSAADLARLIQIAMGSISEVSYLLLLAKDLTYLKPEAYFRLDQETQTVRKNLIALQKKICERQAALKSSQPSLS